MNETVARKESGGSRGCHGLGTSCTAVDPAQVGGPPSASEMATDRPLHLCSRLVRGALDGPFRIRYPLKSSTAKLSAHPRVHAEERRRGAMMFLCTWGIHRWVARTATFNPARMVRRCERCSSVKVRLLAPRPSPPCSVHERIQRAVAPPYSLKPALTPPEPVAAPIDSKSEAAALA